LPYNNSVNRRTFLSGAALSGAALSGPAALPLAAQTGSSVPIIDTHIHLFDPTRPQGVPWPDKDNAILYRPALPGRYREIAVPLGVRGAIEVECSPWFEDNQGVLDVAAKDPIIVGTIGDLQPGNPKFREQLDGLRKNPLFRGIRYGNLWGRNIAEELSSAEFIAGLKHLGEAGMVLDTANPDAALIAAMLRVTDKVPDLRIVIDHLPRIELPSEARARNRYYENLHELGKRPQVYVKVSGVLRRVDGRVPGDLGFYKPVLDQLWDVFGQDRLIYGSDWPNSDLWGEYDKELRVVREYFTTKGAAAMEKYFWKNSVAAYRWVRRDSTQPDPVSV
jgi:L-fuconolactonase